MSGWFNTELHESESNADNNTIWKFKKLDYHDTSFLHRWFACWEEAKTTKTKGKISAGVNQTVTLLMCGV
ncbi:hypothetical protein SARC_06455 [Sphaeroforma arctica JP610]|uniref:Uncharacterized protein n=1 Tax=Sphaeroforma arctica JP610 TaxID=667725 RepID=A0A0L0FZ14_9EUKA|nr:hypothetical protein SARC_06455 [Sphaeroforma arctica JP610]KNC81208.1 hypothetical protein SARC_06455 [Sphaeroforma arctica JP610]|eukprot:XP_014155110.1 hypothetical protein SARC_06455 [Sphaeroforma arctica JP610]